MEHCEPRRLFVALTALPALHSLPSAAAKLYLDFNGSAAIPNWLGTDVPVTPAYNRDNNPNDFSTGEIADITEVWKRVAEKYSPFNIDVTTQDPGNLIDQRTAVIVVGGTGAWTGAEVGGVAPLGGFYNGAPNIGFVFSEGGVFTPKSTAEAAAHEAGHLFGLEHHSVYDPANGEKLEEYDEGNADVAPNMGVAYYSTRGLWAIGPSSPGPDVIQDDLAVLTGTANGFGYRIDDHGPSQFSATTLSPGTNGALNGAGVIAQSTDVDTFRIVSSTGLLKINLNVAEFGPMLDASMVLTDPFGRVIAQSAGPSFGEAISVNVTAGSYTLTVRSAGGYGDIGQYTLTGSLPNGGIGFESDHFLISGTDGDDNISITLVEGDYRVDNNGAVDTVDAVTIKQFDILGGNGNDVITLGPGVPASYILGGGGDDTLTGSAGKDTISGSAGKDLIFGGDGDDRLGGGNGHDILVGGIGYDRMYGDAGNDVMTGGAGVDRLYGGADHDVLSGESSADKCYGEDGNDSVYGGRGNDLLNGGNGYDQIYGGADDDTLYARDTFFDITNGGAGLDKGEIEDADSREDLEELLA